MGVKGPDIASALLIAPGTAADSWDVTGAATINHVDVAGWRPGRRVSLEFDAGATVAHNAGLPPPGSVPFLLAGAANFVATAGDTLTLWYDGAVLRELSRAVI